MQDVSALDAFAVLTSQLDSDAEGERLLWYAVVETCIVDLQSSKESVRQEALEWIASEDFEEVCDNAGLNADYLKRKLREYRESTSAVDSKSRRK